MSNSIVLRPVGKTVAIDLTATSSTAVTVTPTTNDQVNYAAFLNPGAKGCAVTIATSSASAAVLPVNGTASNSFYFPALMTSPVVLAVPANSFSVTGICAATETTTIYVTPVGDQS
jgi:hypothetical protein